MAVFLRPFGRQTFATPRPKEVVGTGDGRTGPFFGTCHSGFSCRGQLHILAAARERLPIHGHRQASRNEERFHSPPR
jgi:hypothetical protein